MITLDLLPLKEKKRFNLNIWYLLAKKITIFFSGLIGTVTVILFLVNYILKIDVDNINKQHSAIVKSNQKINYEIKQWNDNLKRLSKIQEDNIEFSTILFQFSDLVPRGISLNFLSLDTDLSDRKSSRYLNVKLKGVAKTRDDLVGFKEKLNNLDFVENVKLPISSLLKQENIDFELNFKFYLNLKRK